MSAEVVEDHLRSIVLAFRVSDLRALLNFAGRHVAGSKSELQARALSLGNTLGGGGGGW